LRPIRIYQGATRNIVVKTSQNLVGSDDIEVRIDTCPNIMKSIIGGGISGLTASQFVVTIDAADTENVPVANYEMQARAITGSVKTQGRFKVPVSIARSLFV